MRKYNGKEFQNEENKRKNGDKNGKFLLFLKVNFKLNSFDEWNNR